MTPEHPSDPLTPAQHRTLEVLRRRGDPVVFDEDVVEDLTAFVTDALDAFAERLRPADGPDEERRGATSTGGRDRRRDEVLWVSKHRLSSILGCEVHALADDEFSWSPAVAGGQVAHRAIQIGLHWRGDPSPSELVDDALARVAEDDTALGDWVAGLTEGDRADLRGLAVERVTKFFETFPPLDHRSRPMTEARVQWPLHGPVVLSGKVDLVIGRPAGRESRKVIIDLKTGRHRSQHRDDLRFYALLETLRTGVPPRKLASFYLDVGQAEVEDVTEGVLRAAARRTLDAVHALVELTAEGRPPVKRPGPSCHWCPLLAGCDDGREHLDALRRGDDPGTDSGR